MSYALQFDGVNDVVSIPSAMTGNAGTGEYSFRVKSGQNGITVPASGLVGLVGTSQATGSNGLVVNASGQIRVYRGGANLYGSSAQLIFSGVEFDYTLTHLSGGAWDIYDNIAGAPTGQSGTYTQPQLWSSGTTGLNQFGRSSSSNSVYLNGEIELIAVTGLTNSGTWDANLSGGVGSVLPSVSGNNQGTLVNFTVPDCWVFYSTGSSWEGTIGKTSLSITSKQLLTSLGYSTSTSKSSLTLTTDQLSVSVGTVLGVGKQSLVLSTKPEATQLGYVNVLSKQGYNLLTKQLDIVVGNNTPFTGTLNKTTYGLSSKQLAVNAGLNLDVVKGISILSAKPLSNVLGWNSGFDKQTLNVSGKQESTELGYVVYITELNLDVSGKPFNIQTGTSVAFIGELGKSDLNLVGKPLSVSAGTSIPFIGLLGKTSLSLSGKALSRLHGQILDVQKQSITLVTKQLSIGEVVYPIIPVERLFTFTDKGRTYLFKQTTTIYLLTNKNTTYLIEGK